MAHISICHSAHTDSDSRYPVTNMRVIWVIVVLSGILRAAAPPRLYQNVLPTYILIALVAGAAIYSLLTIVAAIRFLATWRPVPSAAEPISILKPLAGLDSGLESNLRTCFEQ